MNYTEAYASWRADPEAWWAEAAKGITWASPWDRVFDPDTGPYGRWFPGAALNTCYNCLDRHVASGRADQPALIWDSAMTGRIETFTYRQLHHRIAKLAGALAALGVTKGDRVVIYLPMVPEAAIAMLATARLGAIHSVVFGGFAAAELASRIADAKPKVIVSASCGLEPGRIVKYKPLLDAAIALSPHKPDACLILQRDAARAELTPGRDHDLQEANEEQSIKGHLFVDVTGAVKIISQAEINLSAPKIVLEASSKISLKVGSSFVVIDPSGVFINGAQVLINSGGSALSVADADMTDPLDAASADPGDPINWRELPNGGGGGGGHHHHTAKASHGLNVTRNKDGSFQVTKGIKVKGNRIMSAR